jgi:hypothetical protein
MAVDPQFLYAILFGAVREAILQSLNKKYTANVFKIATREKSP